ncbi:MAG: hypothetical protein JWP29_1217 [Rhodoferax sp.]|nr:hypothetical protein [Rhodoferax sp.]
MRYDKELQAAGKHFVAAVQGEDGAHGRKTVAHLKENPGWAATLHVRWDGQKLVAKVGTTFAMDTHEPWFLEDSEISLG